jgi:hypothetical protein
MKLSVIDSYCILQQKSCEKPLFLFFAFCAENRLIVQAATTEN